MSSLFRRYKELIDDEVAALKRECDHMVAERIDLKNEIHSLQNDLNAALEKAEKCEARIAELQEEVQRLLDGCKSDEPNLMSFDD